MLHPSYFGGFLPMYIPYLATLKQGDFLILLGLLSCKVYHAAYFGTDLIAFWYGLL